MAKGGTIMPSPEGGTIMSFAEGGTIMSLSRRPEADGDMAAPPEADASGALRDPSGDPATLRWCS
jgi:hypothetical protein